MSDEVVYKKMTRKADAHLEGKVIAKHGKPVNQRLKTYVVLQYLLKYSDENHTKSTYDIMGFWLSVSMLPSLLQRARSRGLWMWFAILLAIIRLPEFGTMRS